MEVTITRADDYKEVSATGDEKCWMGVAAMKATTESEEEALQREVDELKSLMEECVDGHEVTRWVALNIHREVKQKKLDNLRWDKTKTGVR